MFQYVFLQVEVAESQMSFKVFQFHFVAIVMNEVVQHCQHVIMVEEPDEWRYLLGFCWFAHGLITLYFILLIL